MKHCKYLYSLLLVLCCLAGNTTHAFQPPEDCYKVSYTDISKFTGHYKRDAFNYVDVFIQEGQLLFRPFTWTSILYLRKIGNDSFYANKHPDLKVYFNKKNGLIKSLELVGFKNEKGTYQKLSGSATAMDFILQGKIKTGVALLAKESNNDSIAMVNLGKKFFEKFMTRQTLARDYLTELSFRYPRYPELFAALGETYRSLGMKKIAIDYFSKAITLDAKNESVHSALQALGLRTGAALTKNGWAVPYKLDSLFYPPTEKEIKAIWDEWQSRDFSPQKVELINKQDILIGGIPAESFIISHFVNGSRHFGAVVIPKNTTGKKMPAIVELKGVSPGYFPMQVPEGLYTPDFLCTDAKNFIYIIPSFRGEKLVVNNTEYVSEGDRADSWDGATDDAIALLSAALQMFPQIDTARISSFGKSRGGGVSLLMGIRDKRIKKVINWAGPVDWFRYMNVGGWDQQELVTMGLQIQATPFQTGGQFIERFLKRSIEGKEGLAKARLHMIRSSAYYFSEHLPDVQMHYGAEDVSVPPVNGTGMQKRMKATHFSKKATFFFHKGAGHDLDVLIAYKESRKFLLPVSIN
jgi:tetratricopeptide (TPR) repeat protein